ncbi:MAG: alkaline phosphatase family protein [Acidimicrobiales bacterium]|nr:alkaline phosphatase family protein [Acidimicrobiales bacterium]HRW36271.1 alkaline phosphatase family protein [Aquihabitans sp.]
MATGNVLYITVDQWRGDCLSAAGHPVVQTPALDALAARGVRFANHWSVTAPCGPSRASLHTGRYLMGHRSVNNGTPLDERFDNVARIARRHGYDPTLFGYTDTTVDPRTVTDPDDPRLFDYEGVLPGFTEGTVLTWGNMGPWVEWLAELGYDVPDDWEELFEPIPGYPDADRHPDAWAPTRFAAEHTETAFVTGRFLEWHEGRVGAEPWFAHLSYVRPHPPYRAPEGYHDRYDPAAGPAFVRNPDRDAELAMHPLHLGGFHVTGCPEDERELRQLRAAYWGNMAEVDDQLGRLVDELDRRGELDATLIVLTADHGDQMGDHWLVEKLGWWDESYAIPLIVVDPRPEADATRGSAVDAFTESVDVLPTLCTWIDAEVPVEVDGRALQPFLHGPGAPDDWRTEAHIQWDFRDPVDHLPEDLLGVTMEQCALDVLRAADHKYVHVGDGSCLYFDLRTDPQQLVDRSGDPSYLAAVADARSRLLSWRMRHDDRTLTGHRVTEERGLVVRRDPRR